MRNYLAVLSFVVGVILGMWLSRPATVSAQGQSVVHVTRVKIDRRSQGESQTVPGQPFAFSCGTSGVGGINDVDCYVLSRD
jgi:hypothetical protein